MKHEVIEDNLLSQSKQREPEGRLLVRGEHYWNSYFGQFWDD
jgi:hypothetical protein